MRLRGLQSEGREERPQVCRKWGATFDVLVTDSIMQVGHLCVKLLTSKLFWFATILADVRHSRWSHWARTRGGVGAQVRFALAILIPGAKHLPNGQVSVSSSLEVLGAGPCLLAQLPLCEDRWCLHNLPSLCWDQKATSSTAFTEAVSYRARHLCLHDFHALPGRAQASPNPDFVATLKTHYVTYQQRWGIWVFL